jgi:glycosyltransferase involved in cell wall biosynthesis
MNRMANSPIASNYESSAMSANAHRHPYVSVVVPAFNEEGSIEATYRRLTDVLTGLEVRYELIFVNDGSTDNTLDLLERAATADPCVKIVDFSRNFGHQIAVTAGIDHARGDVVVLIDADLQDPPELIAEFLDKWREGYDVVYAIRQRREGETWFKRVTAHWFYRVLRSMTDIDIPLDTGDFRLMSRDVATTLSRIRERHRFLRGMISWIGYRQVGIPYQRAERFAGDSKYPLRKMIKFSVDGITSFSFRPLQFATQAGLVVAVCGFLGIFFVLFEKLFTHDTITGWASLMVVVLFLGGIQLLMLGILGEYIGRIYDEVRGRPMYIVRQTKNFEADTSETTMSSGLAGQADTHVVREWRRDL